MKDKRRKQDVREIAARDGLSYTAALRVLEAQERLADGVQEMMDRLRAFLDERPLHRLWLVHGFEQGEIELVDIDPLREGTGERGVQLTVMQPVVWEIEPRSFPMRASDTPTDGEVDNLKKLLTHYIESGELGDARLAEWSYERDEAELPSEGTALDAQWTVKATIVAR
jgi:hypothetical protein